MDTVTEWFDSVYSDPLYLTLYEQDDDRRAADEAAAAMRLLPTEDDARWLDVCCGFGRHAEKLALSGRRVVGVDRSPVMLERARERARAIATPPDYVRGDLRALPFTDAFDGASLFFDSFGYFSFDVQHQDALFALSAALKTHGRLLIHLSNRERLVAELPARTIEQREGFQITKDHRLDLPAGRLSSTLQIEGGGQTKTWRFDLRLFAASELRELCRRAGFDEIRFLGDWDASPYGPKSPYLILTARKAAFADIPPLTG